LAFRRFSFPTTVALDVVSVSPREGILVKPTLGVGARGFGEPKNQETCMTGQPEDRLPDIRATVARIEDLIVESDGKPLVYSEALIRELHTVLN
jgi:hypothetical protein